MTLPTVTVPVPQPSAPEWQRGVVISQWMAENRIRDSPSNQVYPSGEESNINQYTDGNVVAPSVPLLAYMSDFPQTPMAIGPLTVGTVVMLSGRSMGLSSSLGFVEGGDGRGEEDGEVGVAPVRLAAGYGFEEIVGGRMMRRVESVQFISPDSLDARIQIQGQGGEVGLPVEEREREHISATVGRHVDSSTDSSSDSESFE